MPNNRAVILGGGTMGADVAAIFAAGGMGVDIVQRPGKTRDSLQARVARSVGELGAAKFDLLLHDTLRDVAWKDAGIVVESVSEDLLLKQNIFAELEALAPADIALTSNSSSFPISEIARGLKSRQRMLGLHFFMPAHMVPLVEVVRSDATDPAVAQAVFELMQRLHRKPVMVAKDIPGFLANRMQHALMREAWSLIERGIATPEDVDIAVRYGFGFRYVAAGPILQKEMSGLDVNYLASSTVFPDLCNDAKPAAKLQAKVKAGDIGMKSGKGFYDWPAEKIARVRANYNAALKKGIGILNMESNKGAAEAVADDFSGVTQARAVWDFSSGDGKIFLERIRLIDNALDLLRDRGIDAHFVVTLRGAVLRLVAMDIGRTSFAGDVIEAEHQQKIRAELQALAARGVKVEACLYSMRKRGVEPGNVPAFVVLEENVFANAIALQNKGYAFMRVD